MSELYEFNANGSWISPQMGRYVREHAPLAHEVRVHPMQMRKLVQLYPPEPPKKNADVTLSQLGHVFAGLHLTQDQYMPDSEMHFYDASGALVAKIIGLER